MKNSNDDGESRKRLRISPRKGVLSTRFQPDRFTSLHMHCHRAGRPLDYFCFCFPMPEPTAPIARGFWRKSEDEQLRLAVEKYGTNQWDSVALAVVGRTPTQCRERWTFRISPGLNKAPFSPVEDEIIVRERERLGNRWTLIARQLQGRSSCAVKNRWYSELRKQPKPEIEPADFFSIAHLLSRPPVQVCPDRV
jgi:hypothetical protein